MNQPDLSVAIIFKNESRCLERCLKSLQPLRERLSLQIVMADTGATDGSREIAARYADVLIDFPWINDFAAARNATLAHCTGRWALVIDCDEWLEDIEELVAFLRSENDEYCSVGTIQRNYVTPELDRYTDTMGYRLLNMAAEPRYEGAIHETPAYGQKGKERNERACTILHHDGYVMLNDGSDAGREKRERNVRLLREKLKEQPDELRTLMQLLDCGQNEEGYEDDARHAAALVRKKIGNWQMFGPAVLRSAISIAYQQKMPELEDWGKAAFKLFPDSYFIRIDVAYSMALDAFRKTDEDKVILYGEIFLQARRDAEDDKAVLNDISVSTLHRNNVQDENGMLNNLALCYAYKGDWQQAKRYFEKRSWNALNDSHVKLTLVALRGLLEMRYPAGPLVLDCWEGISRPLPSEEQRDRRIKAFRDFCDACAEAGDAFPSPELLSAASKMRALLAKLPPDDPIALDLKSSDAYQKIAWLIEER